VIPRKGGGSEAISRGRGDYRARHFFAKPWPGAVHSNTGETSIIKQAAEGRAWENKEGREGGAGRGDFKRTSLVQTIAPGEA